jgi:hypothetical protein
LNHYWNYQSNSTIEQFRLLTEQFKMQHYPDDTVTSPLPEIRALLITNEQLVKSLAENQREIAAESRRLIQSISNIEGQLMVICTRLDRIDKDSELSRGEVAAQRARTHSQTWQIWGALLAAILAVVVPLVIRPGAVYPPSGVQQGK